MFGSRCVRCGERNPLVLTLNRADGHDGINPKTESRGGFPPYLKILAGKEDMDRYDLRCYNCQVMYEFQRGMTFAEIRGEVKNAVKKSGMGGQVDLGLDPISISWKFT